MAPPGRLPAALSTKNSEAPRMALKKKAEEKASSLTPLPLAPLTLLKEGVYRKHTYAQREKCIALPLKALAATGRNLDGGSCPALSPLPPALSSFHLPATITGHPNDMGILGCLHTPPHP